MNANQLIASLEKFPQLLPLLLGSVSSEQARWKPPSGNWSILEIVCHLADEEVEDFRPRLQSVLADPTKAWPPIRPAEIARERNYNQQDLAQALARFVRERTASLKWLHGLSNPDWSATHQHPKIGPLRAGDLLGSWATHDLLHLRQITKRLFELTNIAAEPFATEYAGTWTA